MGQQQLLLVILVTIIVGIATVVALNVFGTSAKNANIDAVRQDMLSIATSAQGWFIKPKMMGGGGNSFTGMTFYDITFPFKSSIDSVTVFNMNGTYKLDTSGGSSFTITSFPSSDAGYDTTLTSGIPYMAATVSNNDVTWVKGHKNPN